MAIKKRLHDAKRAYGDKRAAGNLPAKSNNENRKRNGKELRRDIITIALLALLLVSARLYFYTGPVFSNTQDEGIYLNMFSSAVSSHNAISFAAYRNANFSDVTNALFNPVQMFEFYDGFVMPEIALQKLVGFSAAASIAYVMLFSVIELVFIFLILRKISGYRAAVIGGLLLAFLPIDVLFSTQVQPLIPAVAMMAAATYFLVLSIEEKRSMQRRKYLFVLLSAIFIGLGYLINPVSLFLLFFEAIYFLAEALHKSRQAAISIALLLTGFVLAYSIMGFVYLAQSGNFLLYPAVESHIYEYQLYTQSIVRYNAGPVSFSYVTGSPLFYIPIIFNFLDVGITGKVYPLYYFSLMAYAFVAFIPIGIKYRIRYTSFFGAMALLYYIFMNMPTKFLYANGHLSFLMISMQPYISTVLELPIIIVVSLGISKFLGTKRSRIGAYALLALMIAANVLFLAHDTSFYSASVSTLHSFIAFVKQNPNAEFYANPIFAGEVNIMTGSKYSLVMLPSNCTSAFLSNVAANATTKEYFVGGGTIAFALSPQIENATTSCLASYSGIALVKEYKNPFSAYSNEAPPLMIYEAK